MKITETALTLSIGAVALILVILIWKFATAKPPAPAIPAVNDSAKQTGKSYTKEEIARHGSPDDCWLLIDNIVYSVSSYISRHPGGSRRIEEFCGRDANQAFKNRGGEGAHSGFAQQELEGLKIGSLQK